MKHLQFYKNKNVLVTGGAGFIGSHIAETLSKLGAHVTILDDLSSGSIQNIKPYTKRFIAGDITSLKDCLKATKKQDIVFHTAAFISVTESVKYPALCEKINTEGTYNLLEACRTHNVSTFVFSSSAAIYGNRNNECHENDTPNPQSPYAQSKLDGETLCKEYAQYMHTASLRYFNVYGPRQNPNGSYAGVVAKFRHNLINKKPIIIYGNGKQKRDFVHVSKVVDANLSIASLKPLKGEVFNIASGKSINLFNLLQNLKNETKAAPTAVLFKPARRGDILHSQANCQRYKGIFSKRNLI